VDFGFFVLFVLFGVELECFEFLHFSLGLGRHVRLGQRGGALLRRRLVHEEPIVLEDIEPGQRVFVQKRLA